jgi:cephalosporin hydroxylase
MNDLSTATKSPVVDEILQRHSIGDFSFPGGTDKQSIHSYGPVYEQLLSPFKNKKAVILEVGVQLGGSLLLWHDFCPKAYVIGIDIVNSVHPTIFDRMNDDRYFFIQADGYTDETVENIRALAPSGIDVIIDDGPHTLQSQVSFVRLYSQLLRSGGIGIVEDIQDISHVDTLLKSVPSEFSTEIVDRRSIKGRYDDIMLVFKK